MSGCKHLQRACILLGALLAGGVALLVSLAAVWGSGGSGWLVFALVYAAAASVAAPVAVVSLALSIAKGEPYRWLSAGLLVLALGAGWRTRELFFQFGAGLSDTVQRLATARQRPKRRSPSVSGATAPPAPTGEPLKVRVQPPLDR